MKKIWLFTVACMLAIPSMSWAQQINSSGAVAPLASPTFTGTVTMPDASTWPVGGLSIIGPGITIAPQSGSFPNALTISRKSGAASIEYSGTFLVAPSDGSGTEFDASGITFGNSGYHSCTALTTNSSGVIGCTVSAMRFKNPIGMIKPEDALRGVEKLSTVAFDYKDADRFGAGTKVGLYADDVCKMDERACFRDGDGQVKNFDDHAMIGYLVGAIKALDACKIRVFGSCWID